MSVTFGTIWSTSNFELKIQLFYSWVLHRIWSDHQKLPLSKKESLYILPCTVKKIVDFHFFVEKWVFVRFWRWIAQNDRKQNKFFYISIFSLTYLSNFLSPNGQKKNMLNMLIFPGWHQKSSFFFWFESSTLHTSGTDIKLYLPKFWNNIQLKIMIGTHFFFLIKSLNNRFFFRKKKHHFWFCMPK